MVAFDQAFDDCCAAEKTIHQELDRRGLRLACNREFFRGSVSEVVRVVLEAADASNYSVPKADVASAESLLAAGDRHLFGTGDTLQDTGEAIRCYKMAASRGALVAFDRLGRVFVELYANRADRVGRRRALAPLKEGARRGNYYCYAEMAALFAGEGHMANFQKAWELFFARRSGSLVPAVEEGERYAAACCRYIGLCLAVDVAPKHREALLPAGQSMKALLLEELDRVRTDEAARRRVAAILRWTHQELLPDPAPRLPQPSRRSRPLRPAWLSPSIAALIGGTKTGGVRA